MRIQDEPVRTISIGFCYVTNREWSAAGLAATVVLSMLMVMPMAGVGMFGMNIGPMAPMMTLVRHLIFGAVLGWTYGKLHSSASGTTLGRV